MSPGGRPRPGFALVKGALVLACVAGCARPDPSGAPVPAPEFAPYLVREIDGDATRWIERTMSTLDLRSAVAGDIRR